MNVSPHVVWRLSNAKENTAEEDWGRGFGRILARISCGALGGRCDDGKRDG